MPYRWSDDTAETTLCLWPHRSLSPRGFTAFIAITAAFLSLPLLAVLGTAILWGLLPFLAGAVFLTWYFLQRSYRDAELREDLSLTQNQLTLTRTERNGTQQYWHANPYWVRVELHAESGPVDNYITLHGGDRVVELGAFLSADERAILYDELQSRLQHLDRNAH